MYHNWEYVRIENKLPDPNCVYKMQESCAKRGAGCLTWFKRRATEFGANTVVITQTENQQQISTGMWGVNGGDVSTSLADYYYCNTAKNIQPKAQDETPR